MIDAHSQYKDEMKKKIETKEKEINKLTDDINVLKKAMNILDKNEDMAYMLYAMKIY